MSNQNGIVTGNGPGKKSLPQVMGFDEKMDMLKNMGLDVKGNLVAERFLRNISGDMLKGYLSVMTGDDGKLKPGSTFDSLKDLYDFDLELKTILYREIGKIEISFMSRLVEFFSNKYGPVGYLDSGNLDSAKINIAKNDVTVDFKAQIKRNKDVPEIADFINNYAEGNPPFGTIVDYLSLGEMVKFYNVMNSGDRKHFCRLYCRGVNYDNFGTWMDSIHEVRNMYAHYKRICGVELENKPTIFGGGKRKGGGGIPTDGVFGTVVCMKRILCDKDGDEFFLALKGLFDGHPCIDVGVVGFPSDWEDILLNENVR